MLRQQFQPPHACTEINHQAQLVLRRADEAAVVRLDGQDPRGMEVFNVQCEFSGIEIPDFDSLFTRKHESAQVHQNQNKLHESSGENKIKF